MTLPNPLRASTPTQAPANAQAPSRVEPLHALSREPLYQQIADRLKAYIIEHELKPGDKLPTEQALTAVFGVSRSSVREALRFLQAAGIVQIRQRHGVVVTAPGLDELMSQLAFGLQFVGQPETDLWEARLVLEMGALPLSVVRATERDIAEMDDLLQQMNEAVLAPPRYAQLDMAFHRRLLQSARNPILLELARVIEDFFSHPRNQVSSTAAQRQLFTQEHRRLRDCVASGNLAGAQAVLHTHLWRYHSAWGKAPQVEPEGSPS